MYRPEERERSELNAVPSSGETKILKPASVVPAPPSTTQPTTSDSPRALPPPPPAHRGQDPQPPSVATRAAESVLTCTKGNAEVK